MTRQEKTQAIADLSDKFAQNNFFYLADSSTLTVEQVNKLRRKCFEKGIEIQVVKNTLTQKALESAPEERKFDQLYELLKGPTTLMFSSNAKLPAQVISEFRKTSGRPLLKGAYIDSDVFIGDDMLEVLVKLKTKEELIGEIVGMLGSPIQSVLSGLGSSAQTIYGVLDAIAEKGE
jgi:large subunit ribosomal protein L10